jgi:hypothetical protein
MAIKKYEHLIKPLSIGRIKNKRGRQDVKSTGGADQKVLLSGQDLEGLNLHFTWELHNKTGDWHTSRDLHVHSYPECHVFTGLDTANVNYLGADIECCLGEEQETYAFNQPTVVIIPPGLPHGPVTTKRIYSPKGFGFFLAALNASMGTPGKNGRKAVDRDKTPVKPTGKYAHLVKPLRVGLLTERGKLNASRFTLEQMAQRAEMSKKRGEKLGPGNADHLTWLYGKDLEGLNLNVIWGFFSKTGIWHRGVGAHVHPIDEVLVFVGTDSNDINYLGAEIEIDLGQEHERYIFNKPSVIICPAGLPHNPILVRWVDKPYAFFSISLSGERETAPFD